MKKSIIYTNRDNQDFSVSIHSEPKRVSLHLEIIGGNNSLYFLDVDEVKDFCDILLLEATQTLLPRPLGDICDEVSD